VLVHQIFANFKSRKNREIKPCKNSLCQFVLVNTRRMQIQTEGEMEGNMQHSLLEGGPHKEAMLYFVTISEPKNNKFHTNLKNSAGCSRYINHSQSFIQSPIKSKTK